MDKLAKDGLRKRSRHSREAIVAGIFYPSTPEDLNSALDSLIGPETAPAGRKCGAIVSPHGSIQYSGAQAARAWLACSGSIVDTIVMISPSHRSFEPGIFLPESREFSVPNGSFEVDRALLKNLAHSSTTVRIDDIPHLEEHGIEMQLIFAAKWFPRAKILPIIIGGIQDFEIDRLFDTLSLALESRRESSLIVLTSNMAVSEKEQDCLALTAAFIASMTGPEKRCLPPPNSTPDSFCGCRILSAFMRSPIGKNMLPECYGYTTSARYADDGEPVVGYAAIGFSR